MKQVVRIDGRGFYVEPVILEDNDKVPSDCVDKSPPSFFKAQYVNGEWVEGATQEEIEAMKNNIIPEKSPLEILQETVDQLVLDNLMRGV
jgi:hypothetical protein